MKISIIVAMSQNNVIGVKQNIPWYISEDLARFKNLTTGHHILMGRKTFESIGKILPNRTNIILSKDKNLKINDAIIFQDFGDAIRFAQGKKEKELFVIGGEKIYEFTLPLAEKIYQTLVETNFEGDVFFPKLDEDKWIETFKEEHLDNNPSYSFRNLERR